jgi:16S rRNA (cytidine1402-2'-O)-methyltransferase
MSETLYLVATPLGNLEDMTYRAVRILGEVDVIAAEDTRSARRLCEHFAIGVSKLVSLFEGNEAERGQELVAKLLAGRSVAIISEAGSPGISDPGERVVRAAIAAGIRVEVVPGPAAVIAAVTGSGLASGQFGFFGFVPREQGRRRELFGSLRSCGLTMVFYEAPGRVAGTLADLASALGGERPAVLARELTKIHEEYVRGTLAELGERYRAQPPRGECTLIVAGGQGQSPAVDLEGELRALLRQGVSPRDAAARLVVRTGKPRRQIYQLALALMRETREPEVP